MTVEDIEQAPIHGNAFHDGELMNEIDLFIASDNPMDEKVRALRKLNDVMGEDDEVTEESVEVYLEERKEFFDEADEQSIED